MVGTPKWLTIARVLELGGGGGGASEGEKWEAFRDRHGDWGRDVVLYDVRIPNELTSRMLHTSKAGKNVKRFGSKKELYADLGL